MATITAADVNKLRQITGAGMMDCKQALTEAEGNFDTAIDILRKKGQKVANKRADRSANEGIVIGKINKEGTFAAILMLNCETDFVAKNEDFKKFAHDLVDLAIAHKPKTLDELKSLSLNGRTVGDTVSDLIGKIGEKLELSQYACIEAPAVFVYNHQGNRLGTIVGLNKTGTEKIHETGHEIAMQIAAMAPVSIDKDDVDPGVIAREIEIGKEQAQKEGKAEEMFEKIALGKLNKFYKESTLLNQEFVKDNKITVRQLLESQRTKN